MIVAGFEKGADPSRPSAVPVFPINVLRPPVGAERSFDWAPALPAETSVRATRAIVKRRRGTRRFLHDGTAIETASLAPLGGDELDSLTPPCDSSGYGVFGATF